MNDLYKIGASIYRGIVITHWAFRRNRSLLMRMMILCAQIVGVVGIIALFLGACSHNNAQSSNVNRVEMLWRACTPVYTGGGVFQCANPTQFETVIYGRYLRACSHHHVLNSCEKSLAQYTLNEDDLMRIQRAMNAIYEHVYYARSFIRTVFCHARIGYGALNTNTMTWERNTMRIRACYTHNVLPHISISQFNVTRTHTYMYHNTH